MAFVEVEPKQTTQAILQNASKLMSVPAAGMNSQVNQLPKSADFSIR